MSHSSTSASPASTTSRTKSPPKPIQRRHRPINSCFECRRRKAGCSKNYPCTNCVKNCRTCVYGVSNPSPAELGIGPSIQPARHLTDDLFKSLDLGSFMQTASGEPAAIGTLPDHGIPGNLNYSRLGDTCLQVGKLRIVETMSCMLSIDILKLIEDTLSRPPACKTDKLSTSDESYLTPIVAWIRPCLAPSTLGLGNDGSSDDYTTVYFPPPNICGILCQHYFTAVNPIVYLLQEDPFNATVINYFQSPSSASHATRALISAVCFASAVTMPFLLVQQKLGIAKKVLVERLRYATEWSLKIVDFLNSVSMEVMQAAVIYLLALCRNEVSETTSMLVQSLLQNAQLAELNNDSISSSSSSDPSAFQAKHHLWNELSILALRTSSPHTSNPSSIPALLLPSSNPAPPIPTCTDSSLSHLRHACYALHQQIFSSRVHTNPSRISSLAHSLRAQRKHIEAHYLHTLDPSIPLHRYAKVVARLLIAMADFMLFYPQFVQRAGSGEARTEYQGKLRGSLIRSCLDILESAAALETDPGFAVWEWCAGSYQSYACVLFLLGVVVEVEGMGLGETAAVEEGMGMKMELEGGMRNGIEDEIQERISTMTDYIFGDSFGAPLVARGREILEAVREGMRRLVEVKMVVRVDSGLIFSVAGGLGTELVADVQGGEAREEEEEGERERERESLFVSEMAFGAVLAEQEQHWERQDDWWLQG